MAWLNLDQEILEAFTDIQYVADHRIRSGLKANTEMRDGVDYSIVDPVKKNIRGAELRRENPEKERARNAKYHKSNRAKMNAAHRAWRLANPEKVRAQKERWYAKNPEGRSRKAYMREYRKRKWEQANPRLAKEARYREKDRKRLQAWRKKKRLAGLSTGST